MKKFAKIIIIAFVAILIVVIAAAKFAPRLIDINIFKPVMEKNLSKALGGDFTIEGQLSVSFVPGICISADSIHLKVDTKEAIFVEKLTIDGAILPLFFKNIHIHRFKAERPTIFIKRDANGKFNLGKSKSSPKKKEQDNKLPINTLIVKKFTITNGNVTYIDKKSRFKTGVLDFDLSADKCIIIENKRLKLKEWDSFVRDTNLAVKMRGANFSGKGVNILNGKADLAESKGLVTGNPIEMTIHGGIAKGDFSIDLTKKDPQVRLNCNISGLKTKNVMEALEQKKIIEGNMNIAAKGRFSGFKKKILTKTLTGRVSINARNLKLYEFDMDRVLKRYEKSQSFGLLDVGSYFIAGPFGPLLVKMGENIATIAQINGGESLISHLVSDWGVSRGVAVTKDVAFSTRLNRVALKGKVDIPNERFDNLNIAIVDDKGCIRFKQTVNGAFQSPEIKKTNFVVKTIVGPVTSLVKMGKKTILRTACEAFYKGSVPHPEKDSSGAVSKIIGKVTSKINESLVPVTDLENQGAETDDF